MSYWVVIVLGVARRERLSVVQAYRFALDLTARQERVVLAHAGAARVAHNWALARVQAVMGQRAAERTFGVDEVDLTPTLGWSLPVLRRAWNESKGEVAPWWGVFEGGVQHRPGRAGPGPRALHASRTWWSGWTWV